MAYIKCMLLPIMVYLLTSVGAVSLDKLLPKKPAKVEKKYEELIYQSMKSIVSLDELVTTLSVQVAVLTTSLSQMKVDVKKLGEKSGEVSTALKVINYRITENNDAVKVDLKKLGDQNGELSRALKVMNDRITENNDAVKVDVKKLGDQNGELSKALKVMDDRITENNDAVKVDLKKLVDQNGELSKALKVVNDRITKKDGEVTTALRNTGKDLKSTRTEIAKLQRSFDNSKKDFDNEIIKLKASDSEIKAKVANVNKDVAVVTAEQTGGNQKCAKVCAGTTGRYKSKWRRSSSSGIVLDVDLSSCGFVRVPTIATSLEGNTHHWTALGGSSVYHATNRGFRIYVNYRNIRKETAKQRRWNVEWIAVGYTC